MRSLSLVTRAGGLALAVILLVLASGRGPADVAAQTRAVGRARRPRRRRRTRCPPTRRRSSRARRSPRSTALSCHGPGQGQRARRRRAEPQAGGLDVASGSRTSRTGRSSGRSPPGGGHALVAAPARERPLGPSSDSSARSPGSDRPAPSRGASEMSWRLRPRRALPAGRRPRSSAGAPGRRGGPGAPAPIGTRTPSTSSRRSCRSLRSGCRPASCSALAMDRVSRLLAADRALLFVLDDDDRAARAPLGPRLPAR